MAEGEVKIPVSLDTNPAKDALNTLKGEFGKMQQEVHGSLSGVVSGVSSDLKGQLGSLTRAMSSSILQRVGGQGVVDPIVARTNAQERTVQALGVAARGMDPAQIKAIFDVFKQQEQWTLEGRRAVEGATADKVMSTEELAAVSTGLIALNATMGSLINTINNSGSGAGR